MEYTLATCPIFQGHLSAVWLKGAGRAQSYFDRTQIRLEDKLTELTGNDKSHTVVFFCLGSKCWLSYNASLRAIHAEFTNVYWYRGGLDSWKRAGLPTKWLQKANW